MDETSDVSVIVPGTTQAPTAGKQPTPIDEAYGTPRTGNLGVAETTDARAVVTQASKGMMPAVSAAQVIGLYERYLQPEGYHIVPLTDPSRAVEAVRRVKPFAITLNIMMAGTDGWTVLEALKSSPETRNIPVIICSIVEDVEKGYTLGASDYLVKPILEEDLVNSLDRLNADGSIHEVLVIDDNPNDLRMLGKMLTDDGRYRPILAEGGRNGWNMISSGNTPQAIILDLFMPEMDRFEILERMQSERKLRDIPKLLMSLSRSKRFIHASLLTKA